MSDSPTKAAQADSERRLLARAQALFVVIGIIVAGYLSYTYLVQTSIVCGPVGDCEGVRSSAYATVQGVSTPLLGLISYLVVAVLLAARLRYRASLGFLALCAMMVVTLSGTIFSWYLTYIELFVIHAVCTWCLASAFAITVLFYLTGEDLWREIKTTPSGE
jgi:uncharacterized membrane protein